MILVNTMYFKGNWLAKFDEKSTQMRPFHVSKTEISLVPTMIKKAKFNCGEIPEWKASFIEIPYEVNVEILKRKKIVRTELH